MCKILHRSLVYRIQHVTARTILLRFKCNYFFEKLGNVTFLWYESNPNS